jgi:hypothetical protein
MPAPVIGDVVHYYEKPTDAPVAAIITQVHNDGVVLHLVEPLQVTMTRDEHVPHSDQPAARHWTERPTS